MVRDHGYSRELSEPRAARDCETARVMSDRSWPRGGRMRPIFKQKYKKYFKFFISVSRPK